MTNVKTVSVPKRDKARTGRRLAIGASLLAVVAVFFGVAPAYADKPARAPGAVIAIDMSGVAQSIVLRNPTPPTSAAVLVNGQPAKVSGVTPTSDSALSESVLVIDTSTTAATRLPRVRAAALRFVAGIKPGERVAIISAGGLPQLEAALTTDVTVLNTTINSLKSNGATVLFDAVTTASRLLGDQAGPLRSVTVLAASPDAGAKAAGSIARADALDSDVAVNVIALNSDDFSPAAAGTYQQLANDTAGTFDATGDPDQLSSLTDKATARQRSLYTVHFTSDQATAGGNVIVDLGQGPIQAGFVPGALTIGPALRNTVAASDSGVSFLKGGRGIAIALLLGASAAALGAFALGSLLINDDNGLKSVLRPYTEPDADAVEGSALAKNAIFQRAVELTSNIAERQGVLVKAEKALEQANLPLRAAEALTFYVGIVLASAVLGFLFQRTVLAAFVLAVIGALVPPAALSFLAKRRRKSFMLALPDMLTLLAGTLKAGYSFMQGVEAVSREVEDPMGSELRRVVTEAQLGRPLEEALEASAERMASPDFSWAVMAVRIQREVGGNLAELLMTVAETMTARQRLRGEVAALTAEGKISAIVLGILPVGLGAVLFVLNPAYMNVLLHDTLGRIMLGVACVSALAGFAWMKKIININI